MLVYSLWPALITQYSILIIPYHLPVQLSWNLGTSTSWNPLGHSRPVTGLIYLHLPLPILINVQRDATVCSLYFILLLYHSTCFGCGPHPSSGVHKTVVTATGTSHMFMQLPHSSVANLATLEWGSCIDNMTCTSGCNYNVVYSWWWVRTAPETCRVILQ